MLVKNCKMVDGKILDILIEDEKIIKIGKNLKSQDDNIIDAENNLVLPGIIDVHTHMREPGLTQKEDFESGTRAAISGGVTTIIDMPNTIPAVTTYKTLMEKREILKEHSYVDYGLNFGGSREDNSSEIKKIHNLAAATKIFLNVSTGDMLVEDDKVLDNIFKSSQKIATHAEGEMVNKAIELAKKHKKLLYLCHISTKEEVEMIRKAKKEGANIFAEVTPHHLFLNVCDVNKNEKNKLLLRTKPELKTKEDNEVLLEALKDGTIDTVGTDHAPHLISEKLEKLTFGMPSIENSLEMMMKLVPQKISLKRLVEVMAENPAKIFGMVDKGKIEIGYYGDLVIVDENNHSKIDKVITKASWSPYINQERGCKVLKTILRGNLIYDNGKILNKIGREIVMENSKKNVAKALLNVGAVKLNIDTPFTFVSGIKSPIYCDNRQMIGYPLERKIIIDEFIKKLEGKDFDIVAGTATAGIPWAAFIAQKMDKPMSYIRGEKKKHGAGKQIEGASVKDKKIIVIEDLISTGGSSIKAVLAAIEEGAREVEVVSIFSYGFEKAIKNFKEAKISWESLSDFETLIKTANLDEEKRNLALKWNKNPDEWGK